MAKYTICFACTYPDKPGCGCADNDFYAEHSFEGTYAEAEQEARRISWQDYYGDFVWWIVEEKQSKSTQRS
jgi:hypothetical protein